MYVIISASDMDTSFIPVSKPMCKSLIPLNKRPVLQYILDELYSYQSSVDKVVIVKRDPEDIQNYLKYSQQDDFFRTKISCISGNEYKAPLNRKYSMIDDFFYGMEYLVDELKVPYSEVLFWSADEFVLKSKKLSDISTGSFACSNNNEPVSIYRFDNFPVIVNTILTLKNDLQPHDIHDFIKMYSQYDTVSVLDDFGDYRSWDSPECYYLLQSELMSMDEHSSLVISVYPERKQIKKENKYAGLDYTYEVNEASRKVQYNLWSEANFLENVTNEQSVFVPKYIERGINKRGEYCDWVLEEFVNGITLDSLIVNTEVNSPELESILRKILFSVSNIFHGDNSEDTHELYDSYIMPKDLDKFFVSQEKKWNTVLSKLATDFSYEKRMENFFHLSGNETAEWKMFIDNFIESYRNKSTKHEIIYNGTCSRLVHENLTFDNVIYNPFNENISFINPITRKWDIVDKNKDYAMLYVSSFCGLNAILNGYYSEDNGIISISYPVYENLNMCTDILDSLINDNMFFKAYSVILLLTYISELNAKKESKVSLLKYASQLRKSITYQKIL